MLPQLLAERGGLHMRIPQLALVVAGFVAGCNPSEAGNPPLLEAARMEDQNFEKAMAKVDKFREKLKDRGVHPERLAKWVATWPENKQSDVVRTMAGELPGMVGSAPGSSEAVLLEASKMTEEEVIAHKKSKERPK
jgi:hypothetical protein